MARTREYIAWGAVAGMLLAQVGLTAVTRGPTLDAPGEATTSVYGVVVDRVPIPADPDGRAGLPTDRIMRGLLATMTGAAVGLGVLGGLVGWGVARSRRGPEAAEPAVPDRTGGPT